MPKVTEESLKSKPVRVVPQPSVERGAQRKAEACGESNAAHVCVSASCGWTQRLQLGRNAVLFRGSQTAQVMCKWKSSSRPR